MMIIRSAAAALIAASALATPANTRDRAPVVRRSFAEPSYSPDGREIAFASAGDIWTVPAAGGDAHLLVAGSSNDHRPLYSPDGSQLAFMSSRNGGTNIYVLTIASGALRRLTFGDGTDQLDAWSRDGKWLYFSTTANDIAGMSDVYRVSAQGGTPSAVAADRYAAEYWAAPAPDGATIAITARGLPFAQWWRRGHSHIDESEIWLVHGIEPGTRGTPKYEPVTTGGARSEWPMWTPDGKTLYFVSDRSGAPNLWTRAAAGGEARQLTKFTDGRVLWPAISYDGREISFERDFGIWRYDVASGSATAVPIELRGSAAGAVVEHRTLTDGLQELALSPDGRKVAFEVRGKIFAASSKDGGTGQRVSADGKTQQQPSWAPDSRRLAFADDRDGHFHIYLYDFVSHQERQLTSGSENDVTPVWSPDGTMLAYVRGGEELHVLAVGTSPAKKGAPPADRIVAHAWMGRAPFMSDRALVWSPDGKWLAYVKRDGSKLFANANLVSVTGGESRPVSFLSNTNADALSWSPDGAFLLLMTSQRTEPGAVARVDLVPRTPRFREDQFRDLFNTNTPSSPTERRSQPAPSRDEKPERPSPARDSARDTTRDTTHAAAHDSTARAADSAHRDAARHTPVVFDGLRSRLSLLPIGLDVDDESLSPDGKSIVITAVAAGQANLYLFPLDELSKEEPVARQLTSTPGRKSGVQWSPDGREIYYIESGKIAAVNVESRAVRQVAVRAEVDVDSAADRGELFTLIWRELRDNFFDEHMNGVHWNAVHDEYAPLVAGSQTSDEFVRLMNLMVGELDASHSGVRGAAMLVPYTGRLGVRWDGAEYEKSGRLRVSEILPLGPAALAKKIAVGDYVTAVDGTPIDAHTNVDELLAHRVGRQTTLRIASATGSDARDVTVLPVNTNTEKGLLYRAWVEQERAYVAKVSGGRLGYVHMFDMTEESLHRLYADLDAENQANDGVVIDIRNNNGGFVNAYALDVLTRAPYLTMQLRGATAGPARTLLGQRALELPTVLVTNMHSLSDAEDFSEGYRTMKLGKIVGQPTAGWIIYTSNDVLFDGSQVRIPFVRIRGADGSDMELHPRPVDVPVVRPVGESYSGRDSQLDAAVKTLLEQIGPTGTHAKTP